MKRLLALALAASVPPSVAQTAAEPVTPAAIVAEAPASDWRPIAPADLLVMTLAPDSAGEPRVVIIQLIPPPFSEGWVGNIRTLAKAHWWDGTSVYRVVDNWVTQWGDGEDDRAPAKPLPPGLQRVPESEYEVGRRHAGGVEGDASGFVSLPELAPAMPDDPYAEVSGFVGGFPAAGTRPQGARLWPIHCYGTVGVARDLSPDTGSGAELYAVIGHAPRQLDRNIAVVGRVIEGIEHLSALPRGKGEAGVYDDPKLRVPIVSVRLGDDLPKSATPRFEYLEPGSPSFGRYRHVSANRNDPFYRVAAGGIDVCNLKVPVRRIEADRDVR